MLYVHRAERADRLVDALGELLATPLADPLAAEVVAVPTRGVERWLTQQLSTRLGATPERADGVCGNVEFPFPGRLVGGATASATGVDPATDPWRPERSVWPLLDVVEHGLGEEWLAPLAAHLGRQQPDGNEASLPERTDNDEPQPVTSAGVLEDPRHARRFGSLRRLADLFDRYAVHRPAMLRAWATGEENDGAGEALPWDAAWQARLWRQLRAVIGMPSPAERLPEACAQLRADSGLVDLPPRLSLFGLTRLPASYLDVVDALAGDRDVHLFLLHPSARLWARIEEEGTAPGALPRRRHDPTAAIPTNPLLTTWGRDAREMQTVLAAGASANAGTHHPLDEANGTLLQRVQADVRADRCPPGAPLPGSEDARPALAPTDGSVTVHACHGRARQVEVARDAILHLLADDPTLEPRDIVVMCPDIEGFTPLIHAAFGAAAVVSDTAPAEGPPDLGVRLADRSLRQTNPVLGVVAELLDLVPARLTASQVVDLASREPVRRRFRLDDEDLSRIEEWVADAGIRWGFDAEHRAPFKLDQLEANTWRAGLDRVLLGVTMTEDDQPLLDGVLPLDDVDSTDIDLAGRLAELIDRLHDAVDRLSVTQPVTEWADVIAEAAEALTATGEEEAWQHAQLRRLLSDVIDEAGTDGRGGATPLAPAEVTELLADRLRGRPTRANFRTGHVTVCTLVPMRSVPHRVVCLLGLDDGVFPRQAVPDGDDLVARDPYVGDRDPRSEDRQLLLDALLAATDHLTITYTGRDERTNASYPPAVPVGELLDVIDDTVRPDGDTDPHADAAPHIDGAREGREAAGGRRGAARDQVVVEHPLQPFDARNFTTGALLHGRRWSFDTAALAGARAAALPRRESAPFLSGPLPPAAREPIELDDLVAFVQHPVRAFLRQRLGVALPERHRELDDALPVELDGLREWEVGQRMLEARLAGVDAATARAAEAARGQLPPGALGRPVLDRVTATVEELVARATTLVQGQEDATATEVTVHLGDGRMLVGTVPHLFGDRLRAVTYSRLAATQRLAAWVRLLALTAASPDRPVEAATVGRGADDGVAVASIACLGGDVETRETTARSCLADLVDCYDRGMREPLPLYCRTSAAYVESRRNGRDSVHNARREWTSPPWRGTGEDAEAEHQLVLGGVATFEKLLTAPPRDDENGPGWALEETTRFGRYAHRLWDGLLAREEVANP